MAEPGLIARSTAAAAPAMYHAPITPSDDADLDPVPAAIVVVADGDIAIKDAAGVDVTYPAGAFFNGLMPFRPTRVLETTTATLVGWYHSDPEYTPPE